MFGVLEPDTETMLRMELTELRRLTAQMNSERKVTQDMVEIKYDKIAEHVLLSLRGEQPDKQPDNRIRVAGTAMRHVYGGKQ